MKRTIALVLLVIMVMTMVLTGCGKSGSTPAPAAPEKTAEPEAVAEPEEAAEPEQAAEPEEAAKPAVSGKDTLIIAVQGDTPSLNGAQNSRTMDAVVWPTLFMVEETENGSYAYVVNEFSPVESAELSEDKLSIVLTLKPNVAMHDGTVMDAADVVTSIQVEKDLSANAANGGGKFIDSVEQIDDSHVKVNFLNATVSNWQALGSMRVFSKEAFEAAGSDFDHFVNTPEAFASYGPYVFKEVVPGDHFTFTKFDNYFVENDSPIKTIIFRRIDEANVAMMELQTQGVDVIMYPSEADITDVKNGVYGEDIKYVAATGQYQQLIVFNLCADSLCSNVNVRKALCYAIDRMSMWQGAFDSSGEFATTPVTKAQEFIEEMEEPYPQDLEKAKQMLTEAGIEEGATFRVCVDNDAYRTTAVEMFKNIMTGMGYNVEIKTGDNAAYKEMCNNTTTWDLEFGKSGMIGCVAYWNSVQ